MKNTLTRKQTIAIGAIAGIGALLAALILLPSGAGKATGGEPSHAEAGHKDDHKEGGKEEHGHEHGKETDAKGANKAAAASEEHAELVEFSAQQIQSAGITLEAAGPALIGSSVTLPGEIRFNGDRTAHVVPRVAGVVESVSADLGQHVKKGQVLAVVASADLSERRSELLSARQRLNLARTTAEREKQLWQDKVAPELDYLQAKQAMNEAEIAVRNAQQKLDALGADASATTSSRLSAYQIRAPFDGMVLEKHISQGEAVKEDANVFTISDLSTVWAEVAVSPSDLDALRVGQQATVKATALNASASGTVIHVGSLLGEQTRTAMARLSLRNPDLAWRPGLFVSVDAASKASNAAITVAAEAVQTVEGKAAVFVRTPQGFLAQPVTTGRSDGKRTEILSGLKAGAQYAAVNSFVVKAQQGKAGAEHSH
ncbi:efflux RND transporter periplasmic adaptor subunit [Massilia sp. YIM B04103]|uniref:efflux RND transporter periplasmic adaptor subunit n=1 Tax=Massilia sp. YIM B04103 TaxID=2963106 RepID=UPI00210CCFBA|nr:efflux RND transporter periplasmic adaptor subunit [Massilia sp. YIM B04103]